MTGGGSDVAFAHVLAQLLKRVSDPYEPMISLISVPAYLTYRDALLSRMDPELRLATDTIDWGVIVISFGITTIIVAHVLKEVLKLSSIIIYLLLKLVGASILVTCVATMLYEKGYAGLKHGIIWIQIVSDPIIKMASSWVE